MTDECMRIEWPWPKQPKWNSGTVPDARKFHLTRYKQNGNNPQHQMVKETNLFAHVWQMCLFTETMKASIGVSVCVAVKRNKTKQNEAKRMKTEE